MNSTEQHWFLRSFSCFKPNGSIRVPGPKTTNTGGNGDWATQEASKSHPIRLTLTADGHMLITKYKTVLESIFLPFEETNIRSSKILQKGSSLVFMHNVSEQESRIFRVQFLEKDATSNDEASCEECAKALSHYFTVRCDLSTTSTSEKKTGKETNNETTKEVKKKLKMCVMASKVLENAFDDLPLIYRKCIFNRDKTSDEDGASSLNQFLCMCLADPTFPSFVGKVDTILKNLTKKSS